MVLRSLRLWFSELVSPVQHGPAEVPLTPPDERRAVDQRQEQATQIRLRMQARLQVLDAEAEIITRDNSLATPE